MTPIPREGAMSRDAMRILRRRYMEFTLDKEDHKPPKPKKVTNWKKEFEK